MENKAIGKTYDYSNLNLYNFIEVLNNLGIYDVVNLTLSNPRGIMLGNCIIEIMNKRAKKLGARLIQNHIQGEIYQMSFCPINTKEEIDFMPIYDNLIKSIIELRDGLPKEHNFVDGVKMSNIELCLTRAISQLAIYKEKHECTQ